MQTEQPEHSQPIIVAIDRAELIPFLRHVGIQQPSAMSPLESVGVPSAGAIRTPAEISALHAADLDRFATAAAVLAAPDRVLDLTTATFNSAPAPARLCSSRRSATGWAGIRTAFNTDLEVLAPMSDQHLLTWVRLQLEQSAGAEVPVPWDQLDGTQLAFLLVLLDAHAAAVHASYTTRRALNAPISVRLSDILSAQSESLRTRDRRWLSTAVGEVLDLMVHPGGRRGVGLPPIGLELATAEIGRYVEHGWLEMTDATDNPAVRLAGPLPAVAATLGGWLQLVSLHDTQVTSVEGGAAVAQHDAIVFVVGSTATWAISSVSLNAAHADLGTVRFRLHTVNAVSGERLAAALLQLLPAADLPDECYAPAPTLASPPPPQLPLPALPPQAPPPLTAPGAALAPPRAPVDLPPPMAPNS